MQTIEIGGTSYDVRDGVILGAPCCCPQCDEEGRQPGHRWCDESLSGFVEAEREGRVFRSLNSAWRWEVA